VVLIFADVDIQLEKSKVPIETIEDRGKLVIGECSRNDRDG